MKTSMIQKLIKQAKAGRFGENFVSIGHGAEKELDEIEGSVSKLHRVLGLPSTYEDTVARVQSIASEL